jgi:hypothetical protein
MKDLRILALASVSLLPVLSSGGWDTTIDAFLYPGLFDFTADDRGFRFTELIPAEAGDASLATHILVEGLLPATATPGIFASNYTAINAADGSVKDAGVFYVDLPDAVGDNAPPLASAIVGVVPRAGAWSEYAPEAPAQSTVGGVTGTARMAGGTISLTLSRDGQTGSASISYTETGEDLLDLAAFAIALGGNTHNFAATQLARTGDGYIGTLESLDAAEYDSLMFSIRLVEGAVAPVDPVQLVAGEWTLDARIGRVYGAGGDWAWSLLFGWAEVGAFPWMYLPQTGWVRHIMGGIEAGPIWLYSSQAQWLRVDPSRYGRYQSSASGWEWLYFHRP